MQLQNFDLIVRLPRSGIVPAYMIGLHLNIHCTDLASFIGNIKLEVGRTSAAKSSQFQYSHDAKQLLLLMITLLLEIH